jgi:hypothetical protein
MISTNRAGHPWVKPAHDDEGLDGLLGCRKTMHRPLRHECAQRRRPQWLVEYLDRAGAGGLAHSGGAIGSDEYGRNLRSE